MSGRLNMWRNLVKVIAEDSLDVGTEGMHGEKKVFYSGPGVMSLSLNWFYVPNYC